MDGIGQRTTSFKASRVRLAPRLLSVPEGGPGVSLASARRGELRGPRTLPAVVRAPSVKICRRPMMVRIDVLLCVAMIQSRRSAIYRAARQVLPRPCPYDAYASYGTDGGVNLVHACRYRRPARRDVGLEPAAELPDSSACTVGTTWRSPELSAAQAS